MDVNVLEEADRITSGARQADYGHPRVNHARTALLWSAWLYARGFDVSLTPEDVCWLNVLQKMSRQINAPKRDNLVDVCGYVRNVERLSEREGQAEDE